MSDTFLKQLTDSQSTWNETHTSSARQDRQYGERACSLHNLPVRAFSESLDVGEDKMSPVYPGYRDRLPFRFTGVIERVDFELGEAVEPTTAELIAQHLQAD